MLLTDIKYSVFLPISMIMVISCSQGHPMHFAYKGEHGPSFWGNINEKCSGQHQSPININVEKVVKTQFPPLDFRGFDVEATAEMVNNGHTAMVSMSNQAHPTISGGPVESKGVYRFLQLHFHWGEINKVGSEVHIDGKSFPMEMHMVFFNKKYKDFNEAQTKSDGITVLGFFFKIHKNDNPNYAMLFSLLDQIIEPEQTVSFPSPLILMDFISEYAFKYFSYTGSLTTPPCTEDVTWINFIDPIEISFEQMKKFRKLKSSSGGLLNNNFRPIQPLNNRTVFKSIPQKKTTAKHVKGQQKCTIRCAIDKK